MNNLFDSINDEMIRASVAVSESMVDYIDKIENIKEFSENEDFNDIVTESVMCFVEYASKEKDEITKWMNEKGYWYDGNNPNKKKKCMRMYHFLKQHDFRPSDSTYLSDIVNRDGSYKRMKLSFDTDGIVMQFTPEEKEILDAFIKYTKPDKNGKKQLFEDTENKIYKMERDGIEINTTAFAQLLGKISMRKQMMEGVNSFYDTDNDVIDLSSNIAKGKQALAQFLLKHEEGHSNDFRSAKGETTPEKRKEIIDTKRNVGINTYKNENKGLQQNLHDARTIEGYADIYSAKNAKMRTKNAGKKTGRKTRSMNSGELKKALLGLDHIVNSKGFSITVENSTEALRSHINAIDEYLSGNKNVEGVNIRGEKYVNEYLTNRQNVESALEIIRNHRDYLNEYVDSNKYYEVMDKLKESLNTKIEPGVLENIKDYVRGICKIGYKVSSIEKIEDSSEKWDDRVNMLLRELESTERIYRGEKSVRNARDFFYTPTIFLKKSDIEKLMTKYNNGKTPKDRDEISKGVNDMIKKSLVTLKKKFEDMISLVAKEYNSMKEFSDLSTQLRYKFASKYVKEYFEDMI